MDHLDRSKQDRMEEGNNEENNNKKKNYGSDETGEPLLRRSEDAGGIPIVHAVPVVSGIRVVNNNNNNNNSSSNGGGVRVVQAVPVQVSSTMVFLPPEETGYFVELPNFPVNVTCPFCRSNVVTRVTYENGAGTLCMSGILCILFWPLFWVPCCVREAQDAHHWCPHCGSEIGVRRAC